jgi:hypothetical protein
MGAAIEVGKKSTIVPGRYRLPRAGIAPTKYERALERFRYDNEAPKSRRAGITIFQVRRMPDRPPQLADVNFASLYAASATAKLGDSFLLQSGRMPLRKEPLMANQNVFVP